MIIGISKNIYIYIYISNMTEQINIYTNKIIYLKMKLSLK